MSAGVPTVAAAGIVPPSLPARLFGLGSVYGKAFRDSLRAAIVLGAVFGLVLLVTAGQVATQFESIAERLAVAEQLKGLPPVFQGMLGEPIGIEHMGGFLSWRILNFLPVMVGIWSLVALSGTLAGELGRGSMDLLASAPIGRTGVALRKLAGYLATLGVAVAILVVAMIVTFAVFSVLPGDAVGVDAGSATFGGG